jgi:hypothetical protein
MIRNTLRRQGKIHFIQMKDDVKRKITLPFVKYECLLFLYTVCEVPVRIWIEMGA